MLKRINPILSPDALHILASMGHGEELLISDGNYPAAGSAKRLVRFDGHGVPELLSGILDLFPLDSFVPQPICLMDVPSGTEEPPIWAEFRNTVMKKDTLFNSVHESRSWKDSVEYAERFAFYERANSCFATFATGETALYACIIIKKGILKKEDISR